MKVFPHFYISELKVHPKIDYFFDDITGTQWKAFVESVKRSGILTPLLIDSDGTVISGAQRIRAAKELGIKEVPCEIREFESEDDRILAIIESNIRQRGVVNSPSVKLGRMLLELERINGIENRDKGGLPKPGQPSRESIRKEMGLDRHTACRAKRLAKTPKVVQELVENGTLSMSAYREFEYKSPEEQKKIAAEISRRYSPESHCTMSNVRAIIAAEPKKAEATPEQTDAITIPVTVGGFTITATLTDQQVESIALQWLARHGIQVAKTVTEPAVLPEKKKEWHTGKTIATGVLQDHISEIIDMYRQGLSANEIGRHYGCCEASIRYHLKKNGIQIRSKSEALKLWSKQKTNAA